MKKPIILSAAVLMALPALATAPLWVRDAKISPDGKSIAFTYKGDIFTVPTSGGQATRITSQQSYETTPIWSPDSKTIAFASDRYGNLDIFTVQADGSSNQWKRLTFNSASEIPEAFTPDGNNILFSAAIQDPAESAMFPTSRMTEVYSVPVQGGAYKQLFATPARNIDFAPDGKSFVYEDVKGFEDTWRKHHTSSVTRDIWRYDIATGKHQRLIDMPGEDLSPVDGGDYLYFLSERAPSKSLNIYQAPSHDYTAAKRLTDFKTHPVRFLSCSSNGTLAFTYDGELYAMSQNGKPEKVKIDIVADFPDELKEISASKGAKGAVASPDGKSVAFLFRGDVYVTSVDYKTTKQISDTPAAETDLVWGNDSTLYYTSERNGKYNIFRASLNSDEPDFSHATVVKEEPVFKTDNNERTAPRLSPDGKKLAFILNRNKLAVLDLKTNKVKELTDGSTWRTRNGRFYYRWSPDSRWIALEIVDRRHDPYTDVAILNVETGQITNITNSGYFDAEPKWILDGNALAFSSERWGMRNHASWGSQMDVVFVFMNQEAFDKAKLSKENLKLAEEAENNVKKADSAEKKKEDSKQGDVDMINVELEGISDRQMRITPLSTDLRDQIVDNSGEKLYFVSGADDGCFIWEYDIRQGDLSMMSKTSESAPVFDISADGKNIFLFGNSLYKFGKNLKPISFIANKVLDPVAEREFMFDNIEREERERFYTPDMHGVEWTQMSKDYRKFLPHINNNYDFAEMVSEWLGELNVSHTGGRYRGASPAGLQQPTASLGALYDLNYDSNGVKIIEILPQGPLFGLNPEIRPGTVIEEINGKAITTEMPVDRLLADAAGVRTRISLKDPDGKKRELVVRPISQSRQSALLYDRWVKNRAADVDRLSNGRLGYVHISSMDDESFRKVYSDLLGKYNDREGVVIDIRWNGGGRLHEDIEVLLSGEKYFTQEIRGEATCDMPSRRWNKPSIMVMAEPCYSNAHGTPWVYSHKKLGKTVGMPVPGTMTSVNWVTMQDPSLVFGIPVVGYRLADGSFLENQQLEPDVKVENNPETIVTGEDLQLKKAVEELLRQIDKK